MPERLTEHTADWRTAAVAVDTDNRLVRNVALTGLESRNGYRYREAALREALALYADKPVFLDHAPRSGRPHERSTRDLVGSIVAPRFEQGRVRADVRVLDTEAGRTFLALAKANGPAVGMSHVVLAERSEDGTEVARLHDVVCVDAVVFPATTSTFRESAVAMPDEVRGGTTGHTEVTEEEEPRITQMSRMGTDGEYAEGVEQHSPASRPTGAHAGYATGSGDVPQRGSTTLNVLRRERDDAIRERDELAAWVERLETERESFDRHRTVDGLLAESRLPAYAITPTFREQLLAATQDERRAWIAERRTLLAAVPPRGPVSPERRGDPTLDLDARLVHALRRTA